jgi:hypothetical protein
MREQRSPALFRPRVRAGAALVAMLTGLLAVEAAGAPSTTFDIGSGGPPSITGSLGGRVAVANGDLLSDLVVRVELGELSPINRNAIIKVVVPIAIRSRDPYEVTVSVASGGTGGTTLAPQLSDVGFGLQNLQLLGKGKRCSVASHRISSPFDNDPSVTVNRTGRATYPSALSDVGASRMVLQGPDLSTGAVNPRVSDNGWRFDAIFALVPQFFEPGTSWVTLTFHIDQAASNLPCL